MTIFSCPVCGSNVFRLSADLKHVECDQCRVSLGSWRALRTKVLGNLRAMQTHEPVWVECARITRH
jgi:hypothetical protein